MQVRRYQRLDSIRGITLFSMILFHVVWDLVHLFRVDWDWFYTIFAFLWQQSICWTFIVLSGFCWSLGKRKLFRAFVTFGAGLLISLVTELVAPVQRIRFGILTFLGAACFLLILLDKYLKKVSPCGGFAFCCAAFLFVYGINDGYVGIKKFLEMKLPVAMYRMGDVGSFVGFTEFQFYSADYFSFFPWIFLFLVGYFTYQIVETGGSLPKLAAKKSWGKIWDWLGRRSLLIYMLHQPVIYGVLLLLDRAKII